MRPAGFIIDVPITLSVAVRGADEQTAMDVARQLADSLIPTDANVAQYVASLKLPRGVMITEAGMESSSEDGCAVLDELPPDGDDEGP